MNESAVERSWFAVDGTLEPIAFDGPSSFRFPDAVAEHIIERYTRPGDWVLDPFCGFGTTSAVAERLSRHGVGFEVDAARAAFAASRVAAPGQVVRARADHAEPEPHPPCALLLTSPPYGSFRDETAIDNPSTYAEDARHLFASFVRFLAPDATLAVEVSPNSRGRPEPAACLDCWPGAYDLFDFREEIVRVNTGPVEAGPGYDHSHILVFAVR